MYEALTKAQLVEITRRVTGSGRDYARMSKGDFVAIVEGLDGDLVQDAINSMGISVGSMRPVVNPVVSVVTPVVPVVRQAKPVKTVPASTLFKGAVKGAKMSLLKSVMVEVWDSPDAPEVDPLYIFDAEHLLFALTSVNKNINCWLGGPASTGKTEFVKNLAAYTGRPFIRVSFDASAEKYELIGGERMRSGSTIYQDGLILQAIHRNGAIILLDEPSFARPEYLSALHAVLEPKGAFVITETGRKVEKAPGVCFFGADNTMGRGDYSGQYGGTREMNSAFLSRFPAKLRFEYLPPKVEARIIAARSGCTPALGTILANFLVVCRAATANAKLLAPPTLREVFALASFISDGLPPRASFEACVVNGSAQESQEELQQLWKANIVEAEIAAAVVSSNAFSDEDEEEVNPVDAMLAS